MVKLCTLAPFTKTVEKTAHSVVQIYCFNNSVTSLLYFNWGKTVCANIMYRIVLTCKVHKKRSQIFDNKGKISLNSVSIKIVKIIYYI